MNSLWYFVTSRNSPLVPNQVLEAAENGKIRVDDRSQVPLEAMVSWGYTLTPVRLLPAASGDRLQWDDERIKNLTFFLSNINESNKTIDLMKVMRDEYEQERKDKIFIPVELRGCILSTIQKSKNFLVDMVATVEKKLKEDGRDFPGIKDEIDGWKAEIAEYDGVLKAVIGETNGKKDLPE